MSQSYYCILTSDPANHAIPMTAEILYSIGVGELSWSYGTGLKSHGAITNWCTGREWPVNCMTVISAQACHSKDGGIQHSDCQLWEEIEWALNYHVTQCTGYSMSFGDQRVGEMMLERKQHSAESCAPGPPVEQPWGTRKTHCYVQRSWGVSMLQLCSVSNSLLHTTLSYKVTGIFF